MFAGQIRMVLAEKAWWALVVVIGLLSFGGVYASDMRRSEYELKAAYVLNFARYVEWPATTFGDAGDPVVIGIVGTDPFGKEMDQTIEGEPVQGRPLEVHRARRVDDLPPCHLVFFCDSESRRLRMTLKQLRNAPLLTVSDIPEFVDRGGMIGFIVVDEHIRFRINLGAAEQAGLRISSKLLRLAVEVTPSDVKEST